MRSKIGVLGGTFNPVHFGHLTLAQDALEQFDLDRVLFVPCARPPHKKPDRLAPARHRLAMLRAAIKGKKGFGVSTVELGRGGVSYSVDTLGELRRRWPGARFYFIIGADTLSELHLWRRIGELLRLCEFVTMRRPGFVFPKGRLGLGDPWPGRLRANLFKGHLVDVSSSDIRRRVREGRGIRRLVPAAVERYILKNGLYAK